MGEPALNMGKPTFSLTATLFLAWSPAILGNSFPILLASLALENEKLAFAGFDATCTYVIYKLHNLVVEIHQTGTYSSWISELRDDRARARIEARIYRLSLGNPGDVKPAGEGISELRIDYGPGYRVYFVRHGATIILLLCGGDKRSQKRDIANAKALAKELKE
jgi:putative addiction module killer protein